MLRAVTKLLPSLVPSSTQLSKAELPKGSGVVLRTPTLEEGSEELKVIPLLADDVESCLLAGICRGWCQGCCQPLLCNRLAYAQDLERCLSPWRWLLFFNGLLFAEDIVLYHNPLQKVYGVCLVYHVKDVQRKAVVISGTSKESSWGRRETTEKMSFLVMLHSAQCAVVSLRLMSSYFLQ